MQFSELQIEVRTGLSIAAGNEFWSDDYIKSIINRANRWACNYKRWPVTEKAKYTSSQANALYYDYPSEFKIDSIARLEIDGKEYKKIRYEDFMKYLEDSPNGTDRLFSDYRRFYFINPKVSVNGKEITIWGQEKPAKLVNNTDITPFAEGEEAGEEAIIKKAISLGLQKAKRYVEAREEAAEAMRILEEIWARIKEGQQLYQSKDRPAFNIPRFF